MSLKSGAEKKRRKGAEKNKEGKGREGEGRRRKGNEGKKTGFSPCWRGWGEKRALKGEAEKDRRGHSAGRRRSRWQAGKGCVKRKGDQGKEKQKQPVNSPKERGEGRAGSRGICAEVGPEAQTSPAAQPQRFSPETPGSPPHTAAQGGGGRLVTKPHIGGQAHRPRAVRDTRATPWGPAGGPAHLLADHHRPGVTGGLVRAQLLPDTPVTPPAAAHTGLAPAQSAAIGQESLWGSPGARGQRRGRGLTAQMGGAQ